MNRLRKQPVAYLRKKEKFPKMFDDNTQILSKFNIANNSKYLIYF